MKKATNCPCGNPLKWADVSGMCGDCRDLALQRTRVRKGRDSRGLPHNPEQGVPESVQAPEAANGGDGQGGDPGAPEGT